MLALRARLLSFQKKQNADTSDFTDGSKASETGKTGTPVYYVSNLHAGKEFYLDSLKGNYQLTFSDDFASVMDEIETEYKEKNKLSDASDSRTDGLTTLQILCLYVTGRIFWLYMCMNRARRV